FDQFLQEYGWRSEGMADPDLAPWIEDPTPAIRVIANFLNRDPVDFDAIRAANQREREEAIEIARSSLTTTELEAFDAALAGCQAANFSWWNEEHDFYIDLRVHIPLRRVALALGRVVGGENEDDPVYLFESEIRSVLSGTRSYADLAALIPA